MRLEIFWFLVCDEYSYSQKHRAQIVICKQMGRPLISKNTEMCCLHGGGWLEIGKITVEVDIISPRGFVPTLKEGYSEGAVQLGGYASSVVVTRLWLRGHFKCSSGFRNRKTDGETRRDQARQGRLGLLFIQQLLVWCFTRPCRHLCQKKCTMH